jgi:DNA primase
VCFIETYRELVARRAPKKVFLDFLANAQPYDGPSNEPYVARLGSDDEPKWWKSWWEVREKPFLLGIANNRQLGRCELLYDFDPRPNESTEELQARVRQTLARIRADGGCVLAVFTSGGRGFHAHGFQPEFASMSLHKVTKLKQRILSRYQCDTAKASPRTLVPIEFEPHWRTGRSKEPIGW